MLYTIKTLSNCSFSGRGDGNGSFGFSSFFPLYVSHAVIEGYRTVRVMSFSTAVPTSRNVNWWMDLKMATVYVFGAFVKVNYLAQRLSW